MNRPTIPMTPTWITQAKANREQIAEAYSVALETLAAKHASYDNWCRRRTELLAQIDASVDGTDRLTLERHLAAAQGKALAAYQEFARAMRDAEDLRQAKMA